jgi:hypothetical protein
MRRTGIFALCVVLVPQVAASYGVRLSAIPEAYWGTWVPAAKIRQDANKSAIVLSAKAYVASAVSCAVDYVAEHQARRALSTRLGTQVNGLIGVILC